MTREIKFYEAIREALDQSMAGDPAVYVLGLGVTDPKGVFGTTLGLEEKYGTERIFDMPLSENAMTGVALGSALTGMRPVLTHQRLDFTLLAMDQIVNQAANWHYMFGGQKSVPMVIRMVIGRGWGQGPQHSQSLQAWFAHVPGLKVVMPFTPYDAKGLLIASIKDNNPVIFIEHRWLHNVSDHVPENEYTVPLGSARIIKEGADVTIAATSHMTLESLRAAEMLAKDGVKAEIIDIRTLKPLDWKTILDSVKKTGHLVVADAGWKFLGFAAEIVAMIAEKGFNDLKAPPVRVALPDCPTPTTRTLANSYYPLAVDIANKTADIVGLKTNYKVKTAISKTPLDVPDMSFTGPF